MKRRMARKMMHGIDDGDAWYEYEMFYKEFNQGFTRRKNSVFKFRRKFRSGEHERYISRHAPIIGELPF